MVVFGKNHLQIQDFSLSQVLVLCRLSLVSFGEIFYQKFELDQLFRVGILCSARERLLLSPKL